MLNQTFYGTSLTSNVTLSHGISDDHGNAVQKQQLFKGIDIKLRNILAYQDNIDPV